MPERKFSITKKQLIGFWIFITIVVAVVFWVGVKFGNSTCSCPETVINPPSPKTIDTKLSDTTQIDTDSSKTIKDNTTNENKKIALKTEKKPAKIQEQQNNKQTKDTNEQEKKQKQTEKKQQSLFTIQISALFEREQAETHIKRFLSQHKELMKNRPYIVEATSSGKHVYRVRIGKFSSRNEANEFKKQHKFSGIVVPIK